MLFNFRAPQAEAQYHDQLREKGLEHLISKGKNQQQPADAAAPQQIQSVVYDGPNHGSIVFHDDPSAEDASMKGPSPAKDESSRPPLITRKNTSEAAKPPVPKPGPKK